MAHIEFTTAEQALVELFDAVDQLIVAMLTTPPNHDMARNTFDSLHSRVVRAKAGYIKALADAAMVQR